jgi:hypothetical protein
MFLVVCAVEESGVMDYVSKCRKWFNELHIGAQGRQQQFSFGKCLTLSAPLMTVVSLHFSLQQLCSFVCNCSRIDTRSPSRCCLSVIYKRVSPRDVLLSIAFFGLK